MTRPAHDFALSGIVTGQDRGVHFQCSCGFAVTRMPLGEDSRGFVCAVHEHVKSAAAAPARVSAAVIIMPVRRRGRAGSADRRALP
jgi:hypothetical protein